MKKYSIDITTTARATVTVEAPNEETAMEYLKENLDGYNLKYEIDEMSAEVDAGWRDVKRGGVMVIGEIWGVTELGEYDLPEADYVVDTKWLEDSGYEVITTIRKRENV